MLELGRDTQFDATAFDSFEQKNTSIKNQLLRTPPDFTELPQPTVAAAAPTVVSRNQHQFLVYIRIIRVLRPPVCRCIAAVTRAAVHPKAMIDMRRRLQVAVHVARKADGGEQSITALPLQNGIECKVRNSSAVHPP